MSGRHLTPGELAFVRQGIRLYEALVADLRALEANGWPAPEDLLDAPLLDTWKPRLKPVKCLQGNVHGHPSIADGDMETAPIVAMPGGNRQDVVRTQSRWYPTWKTEGIAMIRHPLSAAERTKFTASLDYYRQLVAALEDLVEHGWPTDEQLAADPETVMLDAYEFKYREQPVLHGVAVRHPVLGSTWTRTSPLVALSAEHRLARTESRWYRLGETLDAAVRAAALDIAKEEES